MNRANVTTGFVMIVCLSFISVWEKMTQDCCVQTKNGTAFKKRTRKEKEKLHGGGSMLLQVAVRQWNMIQDSWFKWYIHETTALLKHSAVVYNSLRSYSTSIDSYHRNHHFIFNLNGGLEVVFTIKNKKGSDVGQLFAEL